MEAAKGEVAKEGVATEEEAVRGAVVKAVAVAEAAEEEEGVKGVVAKVAGGQVEAVRVAVAKEGVETEAVEAEEEEAVKGVVAKAAAG